MTVGEGGVVRLGDAGGRAQRVGGVLDDLPNQPRGQSGAQGDLIGDRQESPPRDCGVHQHLAGIIRTICSKQLSVRWYRHSVDVVTTWYSSLWTIGTAILMTRCVISIHRGH